MTQKKRDRRVYMYAYNLKRRFGMSMDDWRSMLDSQNGECAISFCHRTPAESRFMIDHDHESGRVRGILCMDHNLALGSLGDSADKIREVLRYLEAA